MAGHRDDGSFAENKAHHPGRKVSRESFFQALTPQYEAFPIPGYGEPTKWAPTPGTVLGDESTGVPGSHTAPTDRIEGWENMIQDDMRISETAGNPYDEAYGPSDMTRRPPVGEWDNEDVFMTPEKKQCSCNGSGTCSRCK